LQALLQWHYLIVTRTIRQASDKFPLSLRGDRRPTEEAHVPKIDFLLRKLNKVGEQLHCALDAVQRI
jgi:hypothetical protein